MRKEKVNIFTEQEKIIIVFPIKALKKQRPYEDIRNLFLYFLFNPDPKLLLFVLFADMHYHSAHNNNNKIR